MSELYDNKPIILVKKYRNKIANMIAEEINYLYFNSILNGSDVENGTKEISLLIDIAKAIGREVYVEHHSYVGEVIDL